MRLTKYTHSCVRLEHDGGVLVIDPGVFSEPEALAGADAVLITHEHPDHLDIEKLAGFGGTVFAHADVLAKVPGTAVASGDEFTAAGFTVRAVGDRHAAIYGDIPGIPNLGYVIDGLYHPGDALHVPDGVPVTTLLLPSAAPWLKLSEGVDFARAVAPERAYPIHEAVLSEAGIGFTDNWYGQLTNTEYRRLAPGTAVDL